VSDGRGDDEPAGAESGGGEASLSGDGVGCGDGVRAGGLEDRAGDCRAPGRDLPVDDVARLRRGRAVAVAAAAVAACRGARDGDGPLPVRSTFARGVRAPAREGSGLTSASERSAPFPRSDRGTGDSSSCASAPPTANAVTHSSNPRVTGRFIWGRRR